MGFYHSGVPPWLVQWVAEHTPIQNAIETGTFYGDSAVLLADSVGTCTSIEITERYALKAKVRFINRPDITIIHGDSRVVLRELCSANAVSAFYWLDGHFSGGDTGGEGEPCPLLDELDAIQTSPARDSCVIAIDDARLFGMSHELDPNMQFYPRLSTVLGTLERYGAHAFLVDDVVIGVPAPLASSFMSLCTSPSLRQRTNVGAVWSAVRWATLFKSQISTARAAARKLKARLRNS